MEAARIARGEIYDLKEAKAENFDMLVVPGGYGVAKNLSDLAESKDMVTVMPEFERLVSEFLLQKANRSDMHISSHHCFNFK